MVEGKDQPQELVDARTDTIRSIAFVAGILLCLFGSYIAVTEAFSDNEVCNSLGCFDTTNPADIWFGLVMCVAGGVLVWVNRRRG